MDKLYHFIAGVIISIITFIIYYKITKSIMYSLLAGIVISTSVGALKEIYDIDHHGNVEILDFVITMLGGYFGGMFIVLFYLDLDLDKN